MDYKLSKITFLIIFFIVISFAGILSFSISKFSENLYEKKVEFLEETYYKKNKELIKSEVNRSLERIRAFREITYSNIEVVLKERVKFLSNLLSMHTEYSDMTTLFNKYDYQIKSISKETYNSYFFVLNKDGEFLYDEISKSNQNKNIFNIYKNNKKIIDFFKEALVLDENYNQLIFTNENNEKISKFVYVKKDTKRDIFIASLISKDDIDKKIKELLFNDFKNNRFGEDNNGYFWIVGFDNHMKMHPIFPEQVGLDLSNQKTLDGKNLMTELKNNVDKENGAFINYKWEHPKDLQIDEKISFAKIIDDWELYIGTGFYRGDLNKLINKEKQMLKKLTNENLYDLFIIIIVTIVLFLIIARLISLEIEKIESKNEEQLYLLEQYKLLLDKSSVVSKTNENGIITYVNDEFEKVSKYNKKEIIGKTHNLVKHSDTPRKQFIKLWETISSGKIWKGIIKNRDKKGESYYNSTTIIPIKNKKGEIIEYISSGTNVTELIENRTKLKDLFKTDTLTGLGNRVSMIDFVSKKQKGVLALINIDRFKEINDSYSHEVGDEVIKALADRLFTFFNGDKYYLYRVQADVFGLFSLMESKQNVIKEIEEFILNLGKKPYEIADKKFIMSYTCGIASNSDNLLTYAGIALAEAKNKKIKIKEFHPSMGSIEEFRNNIQWVERLHNAIKDNRIIAHYQPIYNYHTKKIEKYEALMRLVEDENIIYPNEYLDIAKTTKLYPELTYKMVERVFSKFSKNDLEFSINLSVEDLMNEDLMAYIYEYAQDKALFNRMVFEIVESEEIEDSEQIAKLIKKFKDRGTKIAIDDFGSGYSNYEYLISLQADYLKIDGSMIKLILEDKRTLEVVKSIIKFAKKSNIKVIAEFVSNKEVNKLLKKIGVDYAQGYYHGKPSAQLIS